MRPWKQSHVLNSTFFLLCKNYFNDFSHDVKKTICSIGVLPDRSTQSRYEYENSMWTCEHLWKTKVLQQIFFLLNLDLSLDRSFQIHGWSKVICFSSGKVVQVFVQLKSILPVLSHMQSVTGFLRVVFSRPSSPPLCALLWGCRHYACFLLNTELRMLDKGCDFGLIQTGHFP